MYKIKDLIYYKNFKKFEFDQIKQIYTDYIETESGLNLSFDIIKTLPINYELNRNLNDFFTESHTNRFSNFLCNKESNDESLYFKDVSFYLNLYYTFIGEFRYLEDVIFCLYNIKDKDLQDSIQISSIKIDILLSNKNVFLIENKDYYVAFMKRCL